MQGTIGLVGFRFPVGRAVGEDGSAGMGGLTALPFAPRPGSWAGDGNLQPSAFGAVEICCMEFGSSMLNAYVGRAATGLT